MYVIEASNSWTDSSTTASLTSLQDTSCLSDAAAQLSLLQSLWQTLHLTEEFIIAVHRSLTCACSKLNTLAIRINLDTIYIFTSFISFWCHPENEAMLPLCCHSKVKRFNTTANTNASMHSADECTRPMDDAAQVHCWQCAPYKCLYYVLLLVSS